jgi:hypothetical protein
MDAHGWVHCNNTSTASYWEPEWTFTLGADERATATVAVSPQVIITLWRVIPLVVKPKPYVAMRLGRDAELVQPASIPEGLACDQPIDQ